MPDRGWARAPLLLIALLLGVPMFGVLASLFGTGPEEVMGNLGGTVPRYAPATLLLMGLVAALTGLMGTTTAWIVTVMEFPGRRLLSGALVLPLAAPAYIVAYVYTDLLDYAGPVQTALRAAIGAQGPNDYWFPEIRSIWGAAVMLGIVLYPYVYLLVRAAFLSQGASGWLAARTLGDSPWQAFLRIALPTARPAIAGGLALVMMETLADYGVADYFAVPTFSVGIFRTWLAMGERAAALQLAAAMLMLVFLLVILEAVSRRGRHDRGASADRHLPRMALRGAHIPLAQLACALPVILGFVIPAGVLLSLSLGGGDRLPFGTLFGYAGNSVQIALIVAAMCSVLAIGLGYMARTYPGPVVRGTVRFATLGYALPGALLAVGLLFPLTDVDRALTGFVREVTGERTGLLLTGSIAALAYALTIRFLTVAYNGVAGGLTSVSEHLDAAARSLGAPRTRLVRTIHLPLIAPSLLAGATLVIIDVMRELPATLILRPFNFETLATRVYRLASDERLAEASTAALLIIAIGLVPVLLLERFGGGKSGTSADNA